jgi:hypothetical protein
MPGRHDPVTAGPYLAIRIARKKTRGIALNIQHQERIAKTPKAWEALSRPDLVGRRAHSLLLMANGRRSERELSALLGSDVSDLAEGLFQQGYLQPVPLMLYGESDNG